LVLSLQEKRLEDYVHSRRLDDSLRRTNCKTDGQKVQVAAARKRADFYETTQKQDGISTCSLYHGIVSPFEISLLACYGNTPQK